MYKIAIFDQIVISTDSKQEFSKALVILRLSSWGNQISTNL